MKGLVVVICAPSQGGKDFIAKEMMHDLEYFYDAKTSYATSYKIREPREDDAKHIHCVSDESSIPIPIESQISATVYDSQKLFYDKDEIAQKINNGEIVFIATTSPELATNIKQIFNQFAITVFVKRQQVNKGNMLIEDLKRHGIKLPYISSDKDIRQYVLQHKLATAEDVDSAEKRIEKRLYWYEKMKPEYEAFVADKINGADYIFKNWFTLIGGEWNSEINEKSKGEFSSLLTFIINVIRENNKTNGDWRHKHSFDWFDEEERTKNLFTMRDEWIKYIEAKKERE